MKKVIIIGASGFIGNHLLNELLHSNVEVAAIENKRKIPQLPGVKIVKGGIKSVTSELIDKVNPDIIFHCARPTLPRLKRFGRSVSARKAAVYNQKLIDSCKDATHHPLIAFCSGSLMYGNHEQNITEDFPLNPISYARQYHKGELPILDEIYKKESPVIMLRFPWLLGNGSWFKWFYLEQIRKRQAIPLFGDGTNKLHILDIYDAVRLMVRYAVEKNEGGIFNIFGDKPIPQNHFVHELAKVFKAEVKPNSQIFPKTEKEALEAFTSNIELDTLYPEILKSFKITPLNKTLERIKKDLQSD